MCLILFAWDAHPDYQLIMATNRDEFYNRPSTRAAFWEQFPDVLAGRDLKEGGTWLGLNRKNGRFTAITNYRDPRLERPDAVSRGYLPLNYLSGQHNPLGYMKQVQKECRQYNGFNLLAGNAEALFYLSSAEQKVNRVEPGIYGLSNASLNTPWYKVKRGKKMLEDIAFSNSFTPQDLLEGLYDLEKPPRYELPNTGISFKLEYELASMFIKMKGYGTCSSAVTLIDRKGNYSFVQRVYQPVTGIAKDYEFSFTIDPEN